ncbi:MAG: alpha/beta hydrolase [Clostridia bacterium]|nr:alpha/beta hydrolase [Clostridia bacterium]
MNITDFSCKRDGLVIRGHIFGDQTEGRRVVIISHGFLGNEKTVRGYAELLAKQGFTAVTFDFNGGGPISRSDGKTENMTVLTEREDLFAVIHEVRHQLQPESVDLMGCSQGGFVSALAAKHLGIREIRRLVLFYPALCIPDDARRGQMQTYHFDPEHIPDILGRLPMKLGGAYARSVIQMDPYEAISGYEGPVLLVHGDKDNIVDVQYSRRAKEIYHSCDYYEINGAGHGFTGKANETAGNLLVAFLER